MGGVGPVPISRLVTNSARATGAQMIRSPALGVIKLRTRLWKLAGKCSAHGVRTPWGSEGQCNLECDNDEREGSVYKSPAIRLMSNEYLRDLRHEITDA